MKTFLTAVFVMLPMCTQALVRATLEQQAEIITHIQLAHHATDASKDSLDRPINLAYYQALKEKRRFETEMGVPLDTRGNPLRPPTEQELKKISGGWFGHDRRGEYAQASKDVQEARQKAGEEYNRAIELASQYYNVLPMPQYSSGYTVSGPPWERNKLLTWAPKFSDLPNQDEAGQNEEALKKSYKYNPAFIRSADGAIIFRDAAFFDNSDSPAPGTLASLLFHEYWHVVDARTPESERIDPKNEPATEVRHRLWQLTAGEDIFELPSYDWKQDLKNLAWQHEFSKMWRDAISVGKDPYLPDDRAEFDKLSKTFENHPEWVRQIDGQVEHDLSLMVNTDPEDVDSLDRLKSQAQSDFMKGISDDSIRGLVRGWKKARELDAQLEQRQEAMREAAKVQLLAEMHRQIRNCGFAPDYRENGRIFSGFRQETDETHDGWPSNYKVSHWITLDEMKVDIMFARACVSVTVHGLPPKEASAPCNEGVDIARQRWNEPGFKEDAQLEVRPYEQARCMNYLHDHWTASMTPAGFEQLLSQANQEYRKAVDEAWRQAERERRERESSERSEREAREGRERPDRGPQPNERHAPAPINCGFNSSGAYCR